MGVGFFVTLCCAYTCMKRTFAKATNIKLYVTVIQLVYGIAAAVFEVCGGICTAFYGPAGCAAWDNCVLVEKACSSGAAESWLAKRRTFMDGWFALLLMWTRYFPFNFCIIGTLSLVIMKIDPIYYVFQDFLPATMFKHHWGTIAILRYLLMSVSAFELYRIATLAIIIPSAVGQLGLVVIEILQNGGLSTGVAFEVHDMYHALFSTCQEFTDIIMTVLLSALQFVGVFTWYLAIIGWQFMPASLYLLFLTIAIFILAIVEFVFVPFTYVRDGSKIWIKQLKLCTLSVESGKQGPVRNFKKRTQKKLISRRPFGLYAGILDHRFFPMCKSSKKTFIDTMISFTITVLVEAPSLP
ncbi:hypothetical protein Fcan01_24329 [Folsomia candida]|uniref:Uncharacterized protein n=1 Tax=Folsomia candida TaxID=158441 RepID=A0A226D6Y7_FOLCA|nr:hypothetical protein Fcan01_24329 [Folsomia candida]